MKTKVCTKCKRRKYRSKFHKHRPSKDGLKPYCATCACDAERQARHDPHRKAVQAWHDLTKRVAKQPEYAHVEVRISKELFVAWAETSFAEWFAKRPNVRASIDRIEPAGHYEAGNIRLLPLGENCRRARKNKNVHAPAGKAWCSSCKEYLPVTKFGTNRSRPHGLQNDCNECRAKYRLKRTASRP